MISRASQFFLSVFAPRFLMRGTLSSTSSGAPYIQRKQNGAPQAKKNFGLLEKWCAAGEDKFLVLGNVCRNGDMTGGGRGVADAPRWRTRGGGDAGWRTRGGGRSQVADAPSWRTLPGGGRGVADAGWRTRGGGRRVGSGGGRRRR